MSGTRRGLMARFSGLMRGLFTSWIRQREERSPRAVYEQAIQERLRRYRELKNAVAGILYTRNKLEAEISDRRVELTRTLEDIRRSVRQGDDELSLSLLERKQTLMEELGHCERELAGLRSEADEAKGNLVRFREEIRTLERERTRMMATLANAEARRRLQESFEGITLDEDMRALESVREHVARTQHEAGLEGELGLDPGLDARMRTIRSDARNEAARRELAELKRASVPAALPAAPVAAL